MTDNRTNESYEKLIRHLVTGLREDAGDYAYVARGTPMSHELSWDARNQRAWDAATALEAMLDDRAALEAAARAAQGAAPRPMVGRLDLARHYWRSQGYDYDLHGQDGNSDYEMGLAVADAALAALADTRGAAPQAEAYDHCCNHPKCPGGSLCCCVSEQRLRDCWNQWLLEIAGDTKQAFRDGYQAGQNDPAPWLAAPVLSSSTADEERAKAVRETARYIDRIAPDGLVPKKMILADMETAADRLGRGYRANGNDREEGR